MQNAACSKLPESDAKVIQHHVVIAHYKVTARACPQPRKKNPRQHLLLVSWDLHADVPWGDFYFLSKVTPEKIIL